MPIQQVMYLEHSQGITKGNYVYKEFLWPNGNKKYTCINFNISADETDKNWRITKHSSNEKKQWGILFGAVNIESSIDVLFLGYS